MMSFEKMLVETSESNAAVDSFISAAQTKYGSYSYAAGYLGSVLVRAMNEMPRARRAELRAQLLAHALEMQKEVDKRAA